MLSSPFPLPASGRLFLPGCAIAAGLLTISSPVFAAPASQARSRVAPSKRMAAQTLRVGKTATYPLPRLTTFTLEAGAQNVYCEVKDGTLTVKGLSAGDVRIRLNSPRGTRETISLKLVDASLFRPQQVVTSQVVERAPSEGATPQRDAGATASPTSEQAPSTTLETPSTAETAIAPTGASPLSPDATGAIAAPVPQAPPLPLPSPLQAPAVSSTPLTPSLPAPATAPARSIPVRATPVRTAPTRTRAPQRAPQISAVMPAPARNVRANVAYRTFPRSTGGVRATGAPAGISVTQGLARLLSFPDNILAVFFSDPSVMDARAINARTIAVTGVGPGASTLAVFTARNPGDVVGRANIYRIQTQSRGGTSSAIATRDPRVIGRAVTAALNDPRVRATIISLPDGLATRLQGTVRNEAEVQAAMTTASFFGPRVISSLYVDPNSPTLDAVLSGTVNITPEGALQENLRRITGNSTIELVPLPTGLAFKAEVNSTDEAQALLRVLPSLNQQVIPFIVVRGQANATSPFYNSNVPFLQGEDRQLTQRLHDVTGMTTVYAVRASSNTLACYGTVRTRQEYDTVRRFMLVMAQTSAPSPTQGSSQGGATLRPQGLEGPVLRNYDPVGGYFRNLGLQMFVRITDPGQSVIRKVTVETSILEISRTALKNLGVEVGSATLLSQNFTPPSFNPVTGISAPGIISSTIDPTFRPGVVSAGNGFAGGQSLGILDPFRARINALVNNGDARLLARPNVTAIEGAAAQITLGGERPVPSAVATQGAVGTSIEFRRFGVIISMRPTVTNDNTILLQIRADITQPDRTFEVNVGGAIVPGESVRSVDTTINVRPGDTVVMGGLLTNERRQQLTRIPILGDLPIIGSLFRSKRFENNETELAIFMSPRIEFQPTDMETMAAMQSIPSFPALPSRQEANDILFQNTRQ